MRTSSNLSILDTAGMWASALCALHCLFLPVLLSVSAFSGLLILEDPMLENGLLVFSFILGTASLFPSYLNHHKNEKAIVVLMSGFLLIGFSRFTEGFSESLITATGAMLVAFAHYINFRLSKTSHKK